MGQLRPLMQRNFIEYASYVIIDRAIPELRDGCKPVQRRILTTMFEMHDGKFHKVANVIGETMKLHPHGDASISEALVVLANKEYFIERQGNFGNVVTGHEAAAARYIECRLTPLAVETLFNPALTAYAPSYDGRKMEPQALPAKVPVLLMLGTEGIAVGMATRILPHNFVELLEALAKLLKGQSVEIAPDFMTGGVMDASEYADGKGRVRVRAVIERVDSKRLVIREIPYSTTTTALIASIEGAIQKGKVSVASINDFTTDKVEIEITASRGTSSDEVIPQLYAHTECEVSLGSTMVVIRGNRPAEITVSEYLKEFSGILRDQIRAELEHELSLLEERQHWLTLEQLFIEHKVYKRLEEASSEEALVKTVYEGMKPYRKLFIREMSDDDVKRLLELRIRRISAWDRKKNRGEIDDIVRKIDECRSKLRNLTRTVVEYLRKLIEKYGGAYPRRTRLESFEAVSKKAVALPTIRVSYDPETGFWGSSVRNGQFPLTVSEYDRVIAVTSNGTYRVLAPQEKVWLEGKLLYCDVFDPAKGKQFTVVYRDENKVAWGKKVSVEKFITDKVYELTRGSPTGIDYLSARRFPSPITLHFVPAPRQKLRSFEVDLTKLKPCGLQARGARLHSKPVKRVTLVRTAEGAEAGAPGDPSSAGSAEPAPKHAVKRVRPPGGPPRRARGSSGSRGAAR